MTKRRLERDIESLSEEVLEELDPDERLRVTLTAMDRDRPEWIARLVETCPTEHYVLTDPRYTDRVTYAMQIGHQAMYDLATTLMTVEMLRYQQRTQWVLEYERDDEPDEAELERAKERADRLQDAFESLYVIYHAYERFAEEELGVSLSTWLGWHHEAEQILSAVVDCLDDPVLVDLVADRREEVSLSELVDLYYDGGMELWAETVDGIV